MRESRTEGSNKEPAVCKRAHTHTHIFVLLVRWMSRNIKGEADEINETFLGVEEKNLGVESDFLFQLFPILNILLRFCNFCFY